MTHRLQLFSALLGTAFLTAACTALPPMTEQETQIKTDLAADRFIPASRQMRDAIETQELFAQAAFWSNEYDLNPGDLESSIKLASAVRRLGNPGRAVEITRTTRALYPRDPYLIAEYAAALIASEQSHKAVPVLNEGLSTTPSYGRLWSLKGAALDQQERYAEARQHYDRALRITPAAALPNASDSVRQNLILVLQLQGKTEEAEKIRSYFQPTPRFPQLRPAHNPAAPAGLQQAQRPTQFQPTISQPQLPQARLQTGTAEGQTFKSASEAARAMALKRSQLQTPQQQAFAQQANPVAAPQAYPQQAYPQFYSAQPNSSFENQSNVSNNAEQQRRAQAKTKNEEGRWKLNSQRPFFICCNLNSAIRPR